MRERICSVDGCSRRHQAKGWCQLHYFRWLRHGDPERNLRPRRDPLAVCAADGCLQVVLRDGWCTRHFERIRHHGDPSDTPRTKRLCPHPGCLRSIYESSSFCMEHYPLHREWLDEFWALVQRGNPDECWPWAGRANNWGYPVYRFNVLAHRMAYESTGRVIPPRWVVDHRCVFKLCCNPEHLEAVTHPENVRRGNVPH